MKIKRTILIILVVLSIVLIDTVQAKIFNNRPVISIVEDYKHRLTRAHREKQLKMSCQALHNAPPNRT